MSYKAIAVEKDQRSPTCVWIVAW